MTAATVVKSKQTLEEKHKIAEEIVGVPIEWESDVHGYMECPMKELHTTPTKRGHTVVYLDGVPTFFCWHQSCKEWVELANSELRERLDERSPKERKADAELAAARKNARQVSDNLRRNLPNIIQVWQWDDLFSAPKRLPNESFREFLTVWNPNDYIWIGDVWDTGVNEKKDKSAHFAPAIVWLDRKVNLYGNHYTTGSTFKAGSVDRIAANVEKTSYVIVEFDSLSPDPETNKRMGAAILNYLHKACGLDLAMVVDSGNKSVHGWFHNNQHLNDEAKFFLRQIGAEPQSMRPSHPVRLPGAIRDKGRIQHLLWIA
jgi:hypothetical protein